MTKELTPRQKELLKYIKEDPWITGKELALKMNVTHKCAKWYITALHKIFKVNCRRDLVKVMHEK